MQLTIGSNLLRNTDGIVHIRGRRQIALEWGALDSELLLTMDLFGTGGRHIARLRRNQWTFNDYDRFDLATDARGFNLVDTKSSQVVLEARVVGHDSVVITQGKFYSSGGHPIEITLEDWNRATDSRKTGERPTQDTSPPFAAHEIESIRSALASSPHSVHCPKCGCPLTKERMSSAARRGAILVSCIMCRRCLVVRGQL
jgi:hypothetical protein